jgi:hypothetical protein
LDGERKFDFEEVRVTLKVDKFSGAAAGGQENETLRI